MDTVIADPFWRGFEKDLFGMASIKDLFAVKDRESFLQFERGEITEQQHFDTYFTDRRTVDGQASSPKRPILSHIPPYLPLHGTSTRSPF